LQRVDKNKNVSHNIILLFEKNN